MVYNDIHLSNTWFKSVIRVYVVFIVFASLGLRPWDVNTIKTSIHPYNQHIMCIFHKEHRDHKKRSRSHSPPLSVSLCTSNTAATQTPSLVLMLFSCCLALGQFMIQNLIALSISDFKCLIIIIARVFFFSVH